MKFPICICILALLLTACDSRSDASIRKSLPGIWHMKISYPNGTDIQTTTSVASNGSYVCQFTWHGHSNLVGTFNMEGTLEIKDGRLIDTLTKHSDTKAVLPITNVVRIIRGTASELVLETHEQGQDGIIWRKEKQ